MKMPEHQTHLIRGVATSGGVAMGHVHLLRYRPRHIAFTEAADPEAELRRAEQARDRARRELQDLGETSSREIGPECGQIFLIHQMMLDDRDYWDSVVRVIRARRACAEYAVQQATRQFIAMFSGMEDTYMRARMADVQDIGNRLLHALNPEQASFSPFPEKGGVAAARYFLPSQVLELCAQGVQGFLAQEGSRSSHAAILMRMLGVPAVSALGASFSRLFNGCTVIADGFTGDVLIDPDDASRESYGAFLRAEKGEGELVGQLSGLPSQTRGGRRVAILAGIWQPSDLDLALRMGAEGVGLYRTESLFRDRPDVPGEEEQTRVYRSMVNLLGKRPLTVCAASLGAHSQITCLPFDEEQNPAMGLRGVRYSLRHPELLRTQLRAVLRAAEGGSVSMTFPMVTSAEEFRLARAALSRAEDELRAEGLAFGKVPLGVMIGTPAAALIAEELAREADFFTVSMNGLTQFALAVDRANQSVSTIYDYRHPAVIELARRAVFAAKNAGIPAVICGDAAADPLMLDFFLGLGVDALVVAPSSVLKLRRAVRAMQ